MSSNPQLHDVAIIGAGPCGLAVAARLCEATPSALFTDLEHQRYHFIRKHAERANIIQSKGRAGRMRITTDTAQSTPVRQFSIAVLDSTSSSWIAKWKNQFKAFGIEQLRSPLFFHPDPRDRDGLKEFAHVNQRHAELFELKGVAGKEVSKHHRKKARSKSGFGKSQSLDGMPIDQRDAQDYHTPSNALFCDYCSDIISNYGISDLVSHADVKTISYRSNGSTVFSVPHFELHTDVGITYSRLAVSAIGPGSPQISRTLSQSEFLGARHTSEIPKLGLFSPVLQQRVGKQQTAVMVVGGGLTSAQICNLLVTKGVTKVYHVMRGKYKVKYFDVDLSWVAKYRNLEMAAFWIADNDEERFDKIRSARGGGSITPLFKAIETTHVNKQRLSIHTGTEVVQQDWDPREMKWTIKTEPPIDMPKVDFIYYATGAKADIGDVHMLDELQERWPIDTVQGLPCLTEDLAWSNDVPLFVTGRFAGLKVGPGAANLEGARAGAERIAWRIQDILGNLDTKTTHSTHEKQASSKHANTTEPVNWRESYIDSQRDGNMFEALVEAH